MVVARLQDDQQFSAAGEGFKIRCIRQALTDKKTWLGSEPYIFLG